jgi:UDP-N-acetylmuramoyl-tripeptide--D-alanyl-D-alanine ligase
LGVDADADARLMDARLEPTESVVSAVIDGRPLTYRIGVPGRHWVLNSLAVLAAAAAAGADVGAAASALAALAAPKGRGRRHTVACDGGAFELIDDSYNASPASMRAAFQVLGAARPGPGGRRVAVLGDMLELGPEAPRLHAGLAEALAGAGIDQAFTCGPNMAHLQAALPGRLRAGHAPNSEQLIPLVRAGLRSGDVVVVKGSNGSRMGRVVDALLAGAAEAAPNGRAVNG